MENEEKNQGGENIPKKEDASADDQAGKETQKNDTEEKNNENGEDNVGDDSAHDTSTSGNASPDVTGGQTREERRAKAREVNKK